MAKFFIHRPIVAIVISLAILICGGISILVLPIARFPDISPPAVKVNIQYPGADAETIAQSIAIPVEMQVNGAEQMIYMSSTSTSDGQYNLTCTFDVGKDVDMANVDVNNRVNKAMAQLPNEATKQGVSITKQSPNMLMVISVFSPDNTYDDTFLSNYASIQLVDAINRTKGVGNTTIVGQRDYSMRLWLDPEKLAKLGVSANDVANVVNEQNVLAPSGSIGQPPIQKGTQIQYTVYVKGRLTEIEEFKNMIVKTNPDGSFLRIKDVARVELAARMYTSFGRLNNKPAALVVVYQLPGGNAVETRKLLMKLLKDLEPTMPPGLKYEITLDTTEFILVSIEKVLEALRDASILVLIVVFIFLGSFRATFIPMLAVPVSLVGTFAAFMAMRFSINTLTLFGIVLAVGIVVDDAIVVVEAVESHIEKGLSPMEATEKALDEVTAPVIAIALVLCAVFVPVAFMGGITGQMYKQFALTLSFSVLLSALVALTLTPALCTKILKHRGESKGLLSLFFGAFNKVFGFVTHIYTSIVRFLINYAIVGLILLFAIYAAAFHLVSKTPTAFVPDEDQGYFFVLTMLPDGASYERNEEICSRIAEFAMKEHGVKGVNTLGGLNIMNSTFNSNTSTVVVTLEEWNERKTKETSIRHIMLALRDEVSKYPEAVVIPILPAPIPGLGNAGGFQFELQDRAAHTLDDLDQVTRKFIAAADKDKALMSLNTAFRTTVPQLDVKVDRDKARSMGIPINNIFQTLMIYLGGQPVNDFNLFDRTFKVSIQAEQDFRGRPDSIKRLYVGALDGEQIPISTFVKITEGSGPSLVYRFNMFKTAEITGSSSPGFSSGQGIEAMEKLAAKELPQGYGSSWSGTAFQEKESGSSQVLILILALIFVFLFLAAQYENWGIPFSVILGLPVALLGAYFAITLVGIVANIFVQIGIVMLIGLAAKNAILIVEFAKERYEKEGMSLVDAAVEGARVRFRPIMMTSFAFILGVVPLALCTGAGAGQQRSLGTAVFGGMLAASAIGIFFIPLLYVLAQGLTNFLSKKKKPSQGKRDAGDGHAPPERESGAGADRGAAAPEMKPEKPAKAAEKEAPAEKKAAAESPQKGKDIEMKDLLRELKDDVSGLASSVPHEEKKDDGKGGKS
jgi:hydrophobe/amphiphile efflux-1 (HAE1) family protein